MQAQIATLDPAEGDLAAAELEQIIQANRGRGWDVWREAVLAWHREAIAKARAEAWIPGLARSPDPVVEEALRRFYHHHIGATIRRLKAENLNLRRQLLDAQSSLSSRERDPADIGEHAHSVLARLKSRHRPV
jgi:hypothetical protein